jgi:hypothetical protein
MGNIALTYSYSNEVNNWSKCSSLQIISNERFPLLVKSKVLIDSNNSSHKWYYCWLPLLEIIATIP